MPRAHGAEPCASPCTAKAPPPSGGMMATLRAVYTVRFHAAIYVLHAFQKKSTHGIATSRQDIDLIRQRLAVAERDVRERQSGR
jgi:hypothetical protein